MGSALRPPKALSDRSTLTRSGRVKREVHRARRDWGISVMRRPVKMSEKSAICERVPRREGGQGACPSVSLGDGSVDGASGRAGGAGRGSLNSRSSQRPVPHPPWSGASRRRTGRVERSLNRRRGGTYAEAPLGLELLGDRLAGCHAESVASEAHFLHVGELRELVEVRPDGIGVVELELLAHEAVELWRLFC